MGDDDVTPYGLVNPRLAEETMCRGENGVQWHVCPSCKSERHRKEAVEDLTRNQVARADEHSNLRFEEMPAFEDFIDRFDAGLEWYDCPAECALLFHTRLQAFLREHVTCDKNGKGGIFGRVRCKVVRYEVQGRGSLHAHILL
ncbi:hypothetical protein WJX72_010132 [[Myrmecia] bisecta]|uniref:Helitron helicase-like domain-containing protein n=1 Tax=[Myrmecia] bisecta TaxID=41462 RepID=A0AAW1R971_9CHLO